MKSTPRLENQISASRATHLARPARAADGVGERPEGVGVQRSSIRDVAGLVSRGHQPGYNQLLAWEQVGVWVPRAVPQGQVAIEDLDVDRLADLVDPDAVWWEVPLPFSAPDGP